MIKNYSVVVIDEKRLGVGIGRFCCRWVINILIIFVISACSTHSSSHFGYQSENRPPTHTVAPGDTLFSIAWRYGVKYEALAKYNGISKPYIIHPNQVIRLDVPASLVRAASVKPLGTRGKSAATTKSTKTAKPSGRQKNQTKMTPKINSTSGLQGAPGWRWPVSGPILSSFQGSNGLNKGIDLGGKLGEPVLAAASGQIVYSGSGLRGYGKLLIIKHNETFLSAYAHNHRLLVKEGDLVKVGQRIADMGSSGTDRVKLHFEIRRDGTPVDPLKFLPRR